MLQASPALGLLLVSVVVAAIVAIHLLKPRRVQRVAASTLIWQKAAHRVGKRPARWRWWLALVLSLAIGIGLTLALVRPELRGFGAGARQVVVVLDNGPTMAVRTRDGQTRWAHAVAEARSVIARSAGTVMVMDSMGVSGGSGFVGRDEAMAALGRMAVLPVAEGAPPLLPPPPGTEVHFIGDGVAPVDPPPGAIVHPVFEPADNVAVLRLVTRASSADPLRVDALVQVFNASLVEKAVRLTLRGGERFAVSQTLRVAAGERIDATFDVSDFDGGVLAAAALTQGDAFAADDIAYTVVQPHSRRRVQLVTRGNAPLADALAALPAIRLEVITPERYRHGSRADAYVFDGFAPDRAPDAGALLFQPTHVDWLPTGRPANGPVVVDDWDRTSPIAAAVPWSAVSIGRGELWKVSGGEAATLVRAGAEGVVISGRASAPWIAVGFLSSQSDLPLQPGFAVFLGNALAQLTAATPVRTEPLGAVRVALPNGEVRDGQGHLVESRSTAGMTIFDAQRPDIYTVRSGNARLLVTAGVLDSHLADVNASRFAHASAPATAPSGLPLERWVLVVLACMALLMLDWAAYTRRVTR
jgi:Ca-activated chloride channel family protein